MRDFPREAAEWIETCVRDRGARSIALSGGSTPKPVYALLGASETFPWARVDFYFADERAVPPDHPESTFRLARETLPRARLYRMPADDPDRDAAAERYARELSDPLDLLLLGMGEDGHTASLFPGSAALDEKVRRVIAVKGPKPPFERLTITPPVIESAREILVLVSGASKAAMLDRVQKGPYDPRQLPAQLARRGTWIIDPSCTPPGGRGGIP